jgi:FtsZ-interacting cell division protein YlmF|tara:strand:+ start:2194 stop:2631 length:438 start_codon:yes stop_codon:yes gene_type:complete
MLEKFLISIGLKQPNSIETYSDDPVSTVRPSSENRFTSEEYSGDVKVHEPKDEVEIKVLKTFSEIHNLGLAIKDEYIVAMDIRDIEDQTERRRILDFVTGMAFVSNSTIRSINRDGVFLILPSNSSLPSNERERLQELGLYKINV